MRWFDLLHDLCSQIVKPTQDATAHRICVLASGYLMRFSKRMQLPGMRMRCTPANANGHYRGPPNISSPSTLYFPAEHELKSSCSAGK